MMKTWQTPLMEELNFEATAYSPAGGNRVDGAYTTIDGKYDLPTYGPSGKNSGEPAVDVGQDGKPSVSVH